MWAHVKEMMLSYISSLAGMGHLCAPEEDIQTFGLYMSRCRVQPLGKL